MNGSMGDDEEQALMASATGIFPGAFSEPEFYPEARQASLPETQSRPVTAPTPMTHARPNAIPLSRLGKPMGDTDSQPPPRPLPQSPPAAPSIVGTNADFTQRGHMLGFATIAVSVGAIAGLRFGGPYGGVAGTLFAGAATNGYRAIIHALERSHAAKKEAMISGTWALVSAGLGGYVLWATRDKRRSSGRMIPNRSKGDDGDGDDGDDDAPMVRNGRRSCGIRPIV